MIRPSFGTSGNAIYGLRRRLEIRRTFATRNRTPLKSSSMSSSLPISDRSAQAGLCQSIHSTSSPTVLLISGGNAGIGYEIINKLSKQHDSPFHILMGTRSLARGEEAIKSMGSPSSVTLIQLDITQDSSIDNAYKIIESTYGRLDVLVNNAATAGKDLGGEGEGNELRPGGISTRDLYSHVYNVNVISTAVITEKMLPLLEKSNRPKLIFVSSQLGSIQSFADGEVGHLGIPWYNSSKSALNYLSKFYATVYPHWIVNSVCPGTNATAINGFPVTDDLHPRNGAAIVAKYIEDGEYGVTGSFVGGKGQIVY